jgi:hypothetical protein
LDKDRGTQTEQGDTDRTGGHRQNRWTQTEQDIHDRNGRNVGQVLKCRKYKDRSALNMTHRAIVDHLTLINLSISFTTSLGRPHSLEDTGMGGSTFLRMSELIVFSVSLLLPHKN